MEWFSILLLFFCEPILEYVCIREVAERHLKNFHLDILPSKYDKIPCLLIRKHFNLPKKVIPIEIYMRYILAYIAFWRIVIVILSGIFSNFSIKIGGILFGIFATIVVLWSIPVFVLVCIFGPKTKKIKRAKDKGFKSELELVKVLFSSNSSKWETCLIKKLENVVYKQKGKIFIPIDDIKFVETKILIPNKKYVYYEVKTAECGHSDLLVYSKKDKHIVFQAPIRKK